MDVPITDASHDTSDTSDVILNSQEIKSLEETPILEDSLGSHEVNNYAVTNRSSTGLEGLQGNLRLIIHSLKYLLGQNFISSLLAFKYLGFVH